MIQDIAPRVLHNEFKNNTVPKPDSIVFAFIGSSVLVGWKNGKLQLPYYDQLSCKCTFLFTLDETDCFLAEQEITELPEGFSYKEIRLLREEHADAKAELFAIYTADQLGRWMSDNKYCGSCGTKTVYAADERAIDCPKCKRRIYPRIQPAVIVGITDGDKILMTKYANRGINFYALVAGFTEIGETLEETVQREAEEEVGLKVKNIRYYKSQPWAMADDILAGFFCDVDGDPTIRLDTNELKEGVWVRRENIDGQPDDYSLTNEMMMVFKAGKEPK